jgi:hypothetical protein
MLVRLPACLSPIVFWLMVPTLLRELERVAKFQGVTV